MSYLDDRRFTVDKNNSLSHYKDLTNMQFGYLTVLYKLDIVHKSTHAMWRCRCVCGKELDVLSRDLKRVNNKSCGCKPIYPNRGIDITGKKFGKLLVIRKTETRTSQNSFLWECKCDCGATKYASHGTLKQGNLKSCGCLIPNRGNKDKQRIHKIWVGMIDRCYNKDRKGYKNYGGRGITVCDEWLNDSNKFYEWSIKNGYDNHLTIDRHPNNNGNYEPSNCRWADYNQQSNNRRSNTILLFNGENKTISEWSKIVNINQFAISQRITKLNWSIEDSLTKPLKKKTVCL